MVETNIESESTQSGFTLEKEEVTTTEIANNWILHQVRDGHLQNLQLQLAPWQVSELEKFSFDVSATECLLNTWFIEEPRLSEGVFCNGTWDNIYCWPATPAGTVISRSCKDVFSGSHPNYGPHLRGNAWRVCTENGTWLWNSWTNYTECADSYEEYVKKSAEEKELVSLMQYILFVGSILSLCCLAVSIGIFSYFKCLRCDRITIHIHLMCALFLRYVLLVIITEPFVFDRETSYRSLDITCKAVIAIYLFATMTSINWMFIQGVYINGKITTNVFDSKAPFKIYHTIGWLLPIVTICIYASIMERTHPVKCWKGYSDMDELWILLGPMVIALLANFLFLMNILRVLLTSASTRGGTQSSEIAQFRKAAKATAFLIPLLGVNNLLFVYNPGGNWHKFYVVFNALFGSTQGIFVSVVYCFLSNDVKDAFRRVYRRYQSRRSASSRSSTIGSSRHLHVVWSRRGANRPRADSLVITDVSHMHSDVRSLKGQTCNSLLKLSSTQKLHNSGSTTESGGSPVLTSRDCVSLTGFKKCTVSDV